MKNPDGTYDLPDTNKLFWENDRGEQLHYVKHGIDGDWYDNKGNRHTPTKGRWLPWTPQTFPVRKKCEVRVCWIREHCGRDKVMAAWHAGADSSRYTFTQGERVMKTSDAFWMVLGSGEPVFRHPTKKSAATEAERLARQCPGAEFVVMQSVAAVRKSDVAWTAHDEMDEAEEDIPF